MRRVKTENGIRLKVYAGVTGVLLAVDLDDPAMRAGLLGFAFERRHSSGRTVWLRGMKVFEGQPHQAGEAVDSDKGPIQAFRWSDYTAYAGETYDYTVHACYGAPGRMTLTKGATVKIETGGKSGAVHEIRFNRAAAASQAFARRFPELITAWSKPGGSTVPLPADARKWLSRGLLETITGFAKRASGPAWRLDVAIYEYELDDIAAAVKAAETAGAEVRLIYHAKPGDGQTAENEHALQRHPLKQARARITDRIFHHKFMVLSEKTGGVFTPKAVLAGSTNHTIRGLFRQANVAHVANDPALAAVYAALFEEVWRDLTKPSATKAWINANNPLPAADPWSAKGDAFFSPRSGLGDLAMMKRLVESARRDVMFMTAFDITPTLEDALFGQANDEVLRLGLENTKSRMTGVQRDRTATFVTPAFRKEGLEGQFLREKQMSGDGSIFIHTKMILVDFTSDRPMVISGSHNLSLAASKSNDEAFAVFVGDTDIADHYGCELLRMFDHYKTRWLENQMAAGERSAFLDPTDGWTADYFPLAAPTQKSLERVRFAGR